VEFVTTINDIIGFEETVVCIWSVHIHNMIFAHIFLPAILFAICKAQPYDGTQQVFAPSNDIGSLDQYRLLVKNSVVKMKNSCRVYDYLIDADNKWTEDDGKLEVAPYGSTEEIRSNREFYISTLLRILNENSNEEYLSENDASPGILFNIMLTKILLTDLKLESQLKALLQAKCCRDTGDLINCLEKREPRTIKKVKFHSWGGKRDVSNKMDNVPRIVLRTPFRPWGGK